MALSYYCRNLLNMDIKDLRIGNFIDASIEENDTSAIGIVDFISSDGLIGVKCGHMVTNYMINNLKGIELNEEWLLKIGFIVNSETSYQKDDLLIYLGQFGKNIVYLKQKYKGDIEICDTDYVHQVQNLHFALKGKELTLK